MRNKGGRPSIVDAAKLSAAILSSAEQVFLAEGYSAASIDRIATFAGTSKQTIYARFGNKEALFIAVSNAILGGRFGARRPKAAPLREALVFIADQMLAAMLDPRMVRLYAILTAEAKRFPRLAQMTDVDATFPGRMLMLDVIAAATREGELDCADPHRAMLMLQHMVLDQPLRAAALGLSGADPAEAARWARDAIDIFLDGTRRRKPEAQD